MAELICLQHSTPQLAAMQEFYTSQMGMQLMPIDDAAFGDARLLAGPQRLLLLQEGAEKSLTNAYYIEHHAAQWKLGKALLERLGARELQSPLYEGPGLQIIDPEGNAMSIGRPSKLALRARKRRAKGSVLEGRLQHYGLGTKAPEAMQSFYQDALRFALSDEVFGEDGALRSSFFRASPEHHSVAIFGNGKPGFDHVSYEVSDWNAIKDWADHFASFDTKIFWGPGRHGAGNNLFIFVYDPDMNMLEISSELQVLAPNAPAGRWSFDYKAYNLWGQAAVRV
jgi:catechol 2,3-dioxygenase